MNMPNPYLGRTTITDPDDFFGRREEIENIYERIKSKVPQSVAVVGERKMGKSSLLYYIYHEKDKYLDNPEKYIFIFIDIQGVTINSRDEFFKLLLSRLRENEKLQDIIVVDRRRDDHENVKETVSKLDGDGCKLILFLDEFDLLLQKGSISPELYENLRALANRYAIAYITATVKSPTELTKEYGSPFFNIFTGENIELFSRDEALELIEVPSAREGVPLKNEADFVFEIAGSHPYFIQIACSILFRYKTKKERLDYKKIREKFLNDSRFQFEHIWKYLNKKEKKVLLNLAKSKSVGKKENYILEDLRRKGYVIEKGKGYEIFSSVFKDFMAERKDKNAERHEDTTPAYTTTMVIISLIIAGFAGSIIVLSWIIPGFFSNFMAQIVVTGMVLLFGFVIYLIYRYKEIRYTEIINRTYRKYPKKSLELYEGLNKVKRDLEEEINSPCIFGVLKRWIYEKSYERVKKKIDNSLLEAFEGIMISERFESLPTDLAAHIEKMLVDKKVTKKVYDKFMDALSKSDMKEEDKKELENVIGKWVETE
jgi:signal recognition particle GTPase